MRLIFHKFRHRAFLIHKSNQNFLNGRSCSIASGKTEDILTQHKVCFKSCGTLYDKWRKEKKFLTVPNGPLDFEVNYFDTHKNCLNSVTSPVVLALHGVPGSCKDFSNLALYLHQKGARVVIPSFPDFTMHKPGIFRHSAEEKAQFVKDFVLATSIKRIDTLVVHSGAVYPGLLLCLRQDPVIKSIIMLNPTACSFNTRITKNIKIMEKVVKIAEIPIMLKLLEIAGPTFYKIVKLPIRAENVLDPLLLATTAVHSGFAKSKGNFVQLAKYGFPMLYMFSNDDKLIAKECSYELAHFLGANDTDIYIYNKDGNLIQSGNERGNLKVMCFEYGSHYVFWRQSHIVFEAIGNFMVKLKPQESIKC